MGNLVKNCSRYWFLGSDIEISCLSSSIQISSTYPEGMSCALFSRKSPNVIKISPRWRIFSILFLISNPCLTSLILTTSPLSRRTVGVSIESTNATVAPFPGRSHLTCVPTAIV